MKRLFLVFVTIIFCSALKLIAQKNTYALSILQHRENYKKEFVSDEHSPLTKDDTASLRFYEPHSGYLVQGNFVKVNDEKGFDMQTHNGVIKKYYVYGFVTFTL